MDFRKPAATIIRSNPQSEDTAKVALALIDPCLLHFSFKGSPDRLLASALPQHELVDYLLRVSAAATEHDVNDAEAVIAIWTHGSQLLASEADRSILVAALAAEKLVFVKVDGAELPLGFREAPSVTAPFDPDELLARLQDLRLARDEQHHHEAHADRQMARSARPNASYLALFYFVCLSANAAAWILYFRDVRDPITLGILLGVNGLSLFAILRHQRSRRRVFHDLDSLAPPARLLRPYFFISYARYDSGRVESFLSLVRDLGLRFWIDREGITQAAGWAGQIVGAMKDSDAAVVLCSQASFQSENVAREIYLADHLKKPIAPIFLEAVRPPDELLYFLVKPQQLRLYDIDVTQVPTRLASYLGAIGKP
ncbi:MAG: toll/interleukin-1 receptor domain-containing protein [Hyphomicrobium sp.]|uniref:toll/interleukin-1 receptor domain-containing protein n=1 Tax=Hyphomicrobium sp. TaxID=82 RepID=UPI003D13EE6F